MSGHCGLAKLTHNINRHSQESGRGLEGPSSSWSLTRLQSRCWPDAQLLQMGQDLKFTPLNWGSIHFHVPSVAVGRVQFPTGGWTEGLGPLPNGPLHRALHNMAAGIIRVRARERSLPIPSAILCSSEDTRCSPHSRWGRRGDYTRV